jgi:hypothetical protein
MSQFLINVFHRIHMEEICEDLLTMDSNTEQFGEEPYFLAESLAPSKSAPRLENHLTW